MSRLQVLLPLSLSIHGQLALAVFLFDHLEGEAKEEIKFGSSAEHADPAQVLTILKELYSCAQSYSMLPYNRPSFLDTSWRVRLCRSSR